MGRTPSIDQATGEQLLSAYGRQGSIAGAARECNVSESAARRYLAETPRAATPIVASQRAIIETAGASLFDSTAALEENYRRVQQLIERLEAGIIEVRTSATGERYETMVSPAILVGALREAREHITAATKLLELMYSLEEQRRFRAAVIEEIREEAPECAERILARLRDRRSVGLALSGD